MLLCEFLFFIFAEVCERDGGDWNHGMLKGRDKQELPSAVRDMPRMKAALVIPDHLVGFDNEKRQTEKGTRVLKMSFRWNCTGKACREKKR